MRGVLSFEDLVPTHGKSSLDLGDLLNIRELVSYTDPGCVDTNSVYDVLSTVESFKLNKDTLEVFTDCCYKLLKICEKQEVFDTSIKFYNLRIASFEEYLNSVDERDSKRQRIFLFEDYLSLANILFRKEEDDTTFLLAGSSISYKLLNNFRLNLNRRSRYNAGDKLAFAISKIERKGLSERDVDFNKIQKELSSCMSDYCVENRLIEIREMVDNGFRNTKYFGRDMKSSPRNNLY